MSLLSFVVVAPKRDLAAVISASARAQVLAEVEDLDQVVTTVTEKRPDAILVALDEEPMEVFAALEKLLHPRPLLLFCGPDDSHLILQAMRFGAREYIAPAPDQAEQLGAAVKRLADEVVDAPDGRRAPLIGLIGSKGGVGTSFLACQLSASLARLGGSTALVDGHLRHGDVALFMDLSPPYTFASLASRREPLDATYLRTALAAHPSGVHVLASPKHPEEADGVDVGCVEAVGELLRSEFDWVVWDVPRDFDDRSLAVLDQADPLLLVATPDVPSMNHTRMQLDLLKRLDRSGREVRIVLNRTARGDSVSHRDAQEFLGQPVDAGIPNDFRRASTCVEEGRTLCDVAPRSPLGQAMDDLAGQLHAWCGRTAPARQRGLFERLRGR